MFYDKTDLKTISVMKIFISEFQKGGRVMDSPWDPPMKSDLFPYGCPLVCLSVHDQN